MIFFTKDFLHGGVPPRKLFFTIAFLTKGFLHESLSPEGFSFQGSLVIWELKSKSPACPNLYNVWGIILFANAFEVPGCQRFMNLQRSGIPVSNPK